MSEYMINNFTGGEALTQDSVVWKAPCTILSLNMQEEKETK